jgi:hypothetical protein
MLLALLSVSYFSVVFSQQRASLPSPAREMNKAYAHGEVLEYRVHYGFLNAATIRMSVSSEEKVVEGKRTYQIVGDGVTHSGYNWFFPVKDHYESFIDKDSLLPVKYIRNVKEGGYKDLESAIFDHKAGKVYSSKGVYPAKDNHFQDVLSAIYYLRNYNFSKMNPGDNIHINFYLDKVLYSSRIRFVGRQKIKTDIGTFNTIVLKPQVVVDRVFPNEDSMTIWATDDGNLIPLRVKADLMVGSLKADITKIEGIRNPLTSKVK